MFVPFPWNLTTIYLIDNDQLDLIEYAMILLYVKIELEEERMQNIVGNIHKKDSQMQPV